MSGAQPAGLDGVRILIPRGGDWGEGVARRVRDRGGLPSVAELLRIEPPEDAEPLERAIATWNRGGYDWLLVTSASTAHAIAAAGANAGHGGRIAAVGPATAGVLSDLGLPADVVPDADFSASGLATALLALTGGSPARFLFPASADASPMLERELSGAGHRVDRVTAYRTVPGPRDPESERAVSAGEFDALLVTSGSAAREILSRFSPVPSSTLLAAIGPPTAAALAEGGGRVDVVAGTHSVDGLLDALAAALLVSSPKLSNSTHEPTESRHR